MELSHYEQKKEDIASIPNVTIGKACKKMSNCKRCYRISCCCRASARQHTILDVLRILQSSLDPVFCADLCIVEKSIRVGWMSIFRGKRSSFRSFFKLGGVNKIFLIVCARMSFHNPCAQDFTNSGLFVRMQKIEIFLINLGKYGDFSFI